MKIKETKKTMKDALDLLNDCGYYLRYVNETNPKIEITKDSRVFSYYLSDGEGMFDTYKEFRAWCVEDVIERDGMYCFDITCGVEL